VTLLRAAVAEFVGTALLLSAIVGSGIMAERLFGENVGLALLANAIATGGALAALILAFGPISGAHFNPAVTLTDAWQGGIARTAVVPYLAAQIAGALCGTALANGMFGLPILFLSTHARAGPGMLVSEFVATFGLLAVIWGCVRARSTATPYAVALYIVAAYWFTPSTSFANPAVTIARSLTDTFAGIRPQDAPAFIAAQLAGAFAATVLFAWLSPIAKRTAEAVVTPHMEVAVELARR
jgi:glycerol uptake facilitator-like aquaporin